MADSEAPAAEQKKKSSLMGTLVEFLLITIIAGGAGAALSVMNPPPPPEKNAADQPHEGKLARETKEGEKSETPINCGPGGASLIDLPPIVTNVATPSDTWVRLEGSIVFDPKALPHPEVVAAEIATDELAYLRTVSVSELQGPIGLENIRQDLRDRAAVRSGGKVTELLLKTLVLQ
jgi:flagellar FliL protein